MKFLEQNCHHCHLSNHWRFEWNTIFQNWNLGWRRTLVVLRRSVELPTHTLRTQPTQCNVSHLSLHLWSVSRQGTSLDTRETLSRCCPCIAVDNVLLASSLGYLKCKVVDLTGEARISSVNLRHTMIHFCVTNITRNTNYSCLYYILIMKTDIQILSFISSSSWTSVIGYSKIHEFIIMIFSFVDEVVCIYHILDILHHL